MVRSGRMRVVRQLLLEIARPEASNERLADLARRADPDLLLLGACRHRVESLVASRLGAIAQLPSHLRVELDSTMWRNRAVRSNSLKMLSKFASSVGAPWILVKGPTIAARWYADPSTRDFGDLDVVVRPTDFRRTVHQLEAADFEALAVNWSGFRSWGVAEAPFSLRGSVLDLHWDLIALARQRRHLRLDTTELFERSVALTIDTLAVRALEPTDALLHMCINYGLEGARRLRSLIDIDAAVRSNDVDLDAFVDRARSAGAARMSGAVLQRSKQLLGTPVSSSWLDALSGSTTWLQVHRLVDRASRFRQDPTAGIGSGVLIASTRDGTAPSIGALLGGSGRTLAVRLGRPAPTSAGGALAWTRRTPGDLDTQRERYLAWVDDQAVLDPGG